MKMKKFSAFALVFALMLVLSVTAVFATSSVNQAPEGQLKAAGRYTQDENGKIVLDQEDIAGLLDENDDGPVVFVVDEDGNFSVYQYDFIPDDSGNNWNLGAELTAPREYTDEEMEQIIADIESGRLEGFSLTESGKLEGFSFPDQGEDGYSFVTYSEYCYNGEGDAE